jgi:beta-lactamase regulating signal transducer with metallopeptidase domain/protocatechuate 3,4-dioxygenase beta subunit
VNAIEVWMRSPTVALVGWCLVHSIWQIAACALAAAVILRLLQRGSAQSRYVAACASLTVMAITPIATLSWLAISRVPTEPAALNAQQSQDASQMKGRVDVPQFGPAAELSTLAIQQGKAQGMARPSFSTRLDPWLPALVAMWGMGVVLLATRLLGGWLVLRRLVRRGRPPGDTGSSEIAARLAARLGLGRRVRLLESARVQVPMVVGWLKPVILLPASALTGLTSDQLTFILGHELAHIRRLDYVVNLVQSLIETLLFFHPAVWWISARIRQERENCCDDRAVELCGDRLDYARALAALEGMRTATWSLAPSAEGGALLARIRRLLGLAPRAEPPARGLAGTLALTIVGFLGLALALSPGGNSVQAAIQEQKIITGKVVTSNGKPVDGADVWLVGQTYPQPQAIAIERVRTDKSGRFRQTWDQTRAKGRFLGSHAVWAHRAGFAPARAMFIEEWDESGVDPRHPIKLTLAPTTATAFRILDPQGNPAPGARIRLTKLREDRTSVPDELAERLAAATDQDGQARIEAAAGETIQTIEVTTRDLGSQRFDRNDGFQAQNELKLIAAAAVTGRVVAGDPAATRRLPLHISGMTMLGEGAWVSSLADVVTDEQGAFSVAKLVPGYVSVEATIPEGSIYRQVLKENNFEGARAIELTVPLERWVRVRGQVREKGTGKPVEGVGVRICNGKTVGPIPLVGKSNASGRFDAIAPPGKETFCLPETPKRFLKLVRGIEMPEILTDGQVLPAIELERGETLRGIVVDEDGHPVAGARVLGAWDQIGPGVKAPNGATMFMGSRFTAKADSGPRGEFLLEGIHPGANVLLQAEAGDARSGAPQPAAAGLAEPVKLVITGANTVSLVGRVVDSAQKPIAGAGVLIRSRQARENAAAEPGPVRFEGEGAIVTDEEGRYETPRQLKRGFEYRAEVKPDDPTLLSDKSPWLVLRQSTRPVLGDVVLRRIRSVEGRVLDSRGNPVAGATVRQSGDGPLPTSSITDSSGHFRLPGVLAEPAFLFVATPGYRFAGRAIGGDESSCDLMIERADGPPPPPLKTLSPATTADQERRLLRLIFDPYAEKVLREDRSVYRFEVARVVTALEPERARALLEEDEKRSEPRPPGFGRGEVALALFKHRPSEAIELLAGIPDPNARSYAYEQVAQRFPGSDRTRRLRLLNESLRAARAVKEPADRVLRLADLGRRFTDLGEGELGTRLLREGLDVARRLPTTGWPAFARVNLAEELALIDLPGALDLMKGTEEEREHEQYLGHIAHRLAAKDPAAAERIIRRMHDHWPYFRDMYIQRVCHRMVTVDRERALNLARTTMTNYRYKARALGAMGLALAKSGDRTAATRLVAESFEVLERVAGGDQDQWDGLNMACTVAAGLLPIVEQIDPSLVREYLWRTLAMRPPLRPRDERDGIALIAGSRVAAMVARYDRELARQMLDGLVASDLAKLASGGGRDTAFEVSSLLRAGAFIAPMQTGALLARLPDTSDGSTPSLRDQGRLEVARVLAVPAGVERWKLLERSFLHAWPIDSEED